MTAHHSHPPYRSLDIYHLVVVHHHKQIDVAESFGVDPSRISQVIRRVRNWVDDSIGDWLFPGRDDLRFLVALEFENIHVTETESDPPAVTFQGPQSHYTRSHETAGQADDPPPLTPNTHQPLNMSVPPLNSSAQLVLDSLAATSDPATTSLTPAITELATHIARLLILWKKNRKPSAAIRLNRRRK